MEDPAPESSAAPRGARPPGDDTELLDAYSRAVVGVALWGEEKDLQGERSPEVLTDIEKELRHD